MFGGVLGPTDDLTVVLSDSAGQIYCASNIVKPRQPLFCLRGVANLLALDDVNPPHGLPYRYFAYEVLFVGYHGLFED